MSPLKARVFSGVFLNILLAVTTESASFSFTDSLAMFLGLGQPATMPHYEPMQVIGAGYGRTGSDSLRLALNSIGYRTYHMREAFENGHLGHFADYATGKMSVDQLLDVIAAAGYNATADFPMCMFTIELLRRNPNAKVILSVRDSPKAWAKSYIETIGLCGPMLSRPPLKWVPMVKHVKPMLQWLDDVTDMERDEEGIPLFDSAAASYSRWLEKIKTEVPASRLLVHNSKQGWPPICKFLELADCPKDYPWVNDSESIKRVFTTFKMIADYFPFLVVALLVSCAFLFRWCCCGKKKDKAKSS